MSRRWFCKMKILGYARAFWYQWPNSRFGVFEKKVPRGSNMEATFGTLLWKAVRKKVIEKKRGFFCCSQWLILREASYLPEFINNRRSTKIVTSCELISKKDNFVCVHGEEEEKKKKKADGVIIIVTDDAAPCIPFPVRRNKAHRPPDTIVLSECARTRTVVLWQRARGPKYGEVRVPCERSK